MNYYEVSLATVPVYLLLCSDAQLNRSANVSIPQVKVGVKIFLWSDGSGVGGSCVLQSKVLSGQQSQAYISSQSTGETKTLHAHVITNSVLPPEHLCAAPQSPGETQGRSSHLWTKKSNFNTIKQYDSI